MFEQISHNIALADIPGLGGTIIQLASREECTNTYGKISFKGGERNIRKWGSSNTLPVIREKIIMDNDIIGPLIGTKRNLLLGEGMMAYREVWQPGKDGNPGTTIREEVEMPENAAMFFEEANIHQFNMTNARNLLLHANIWPEFIMAKDRSNGVALLTAQDSRFIRATEQNKKGVVEKYLWSGKWSNEKATADEHTYEIMEIPAFNPKADQAKFIWQLGDDLFGDRYYHEPAYWGSREWIELANCIPSFHLANLRHGYTIRFHIKYRKGYFDSVTPAGASEKDIMEAQQNAKQEMQKTMERINSFLSGLANSGRAIWSEFEFSQALNKEVPGLIIEPIKAELHDKALLELFTMSKETAMASQAIHPTLANVETQGRLSSGSEMRIAYQVYLAIHTPLYRQILMKPVNDIVRKKNGWDPKIMYGFRDTKITTLDEDKEGTKKAITGSGGAKAAA